MILCRGSIMSEHFNQELSLSGKIPSGLFNAMFGFKGCWQNDASTTKILAFDGLFEKYGTHVIVGVKMGGKDVIHIKQLQNSNLQPAEVQKLLKQLADERFCEDGKENLMVNPGTSSGKPKVEQSMIWDLQLPFASTVRPPIVSHSKTDINHLEELTQFLEYQLPRQWAPAYNDLPLGPRSRKKASPALQFTLLGPKLYVNTVKARGAITWPSISSTYQLSLSLFNFHDNSYEPHDESIDRGYFEPVKWSIFSHICTAPVEYHGARIDDSASIVTKAWLRLRTIRVGRTNKRIKEIRIDFHVDEHPIQLCYESTPEAPKVDLNSAFILEDHLRRKGPKMSHFVDTKEMVRGPEDPPGYWVVRRKTLRGERDDTN
ncbi:UNVERIFIED_CONTAM: MACPF domain-containing protein NSL1 [Sesamum radiatum]|uniref:MACPF domain-containing protein NSL1 n=1 Tax=Sesamum radiatum TaxID=300843 RepID=A0AAW2KGY0_SESRA